MNSILLVYLQNKFVKFQKSCWNAREIQLEYLKKILIRNQNTYFGLENHFKEIANNFSVLKFQKLISIRDYNDYQAKIENLLNGIQNQLSQERVNFFNLTSGTTNLSKHIPVNRTFHKESKNLLDIWIGGLLKDHPHAMDGYRLAIPGKAIESFSVSGIPIGSASGLAYKAAPWFIKNKYAIPYEIFEEDDFLNRYLYIIRSALTKDISFIATPNSGTLLQLFDKLQHYSDIILKSLYDGGFFNSELGSRQQKLNFKPDLITAKKLDKNLNRNHGVFDPEMHWKNLKMISVWLGGSCGSQVSLLKEKFPSIPFRDLGYHASEARMSVPFCDNTSEGILAIANNFFEFIPKLDYENERYNCLLINDLKVGEEYYILISNSSGLYRYDLGDVVQVTDFYGQAPIIKFMRKKKDMFDLVGEKLHINHFLFAREKMREHLFLSDERFYIFPSTELNRYELYCEFTNHTTEDKLDELAKKFDGFLQFANWEYLTKRQSNRINEIRIYQIPQGTISLIVSKKFQSGIRDSQFKWNFFSIERPNIER